MTFLFRILPEEFHVIRAIAFLLFAPSRLCVKELNLISLCPCASVLNSRAGRFSSLLHSKVFSGIRFPYLHRSSAQPPQDHVPDPRKSCWSRNRDEQKQKQGHSRRVCDRC